MNSSEMAYVALGSNLGDSATIIREAIRRLADFSHSPLAQSSLWESTPIDCPPNSPAFINAVVSLHPLENESPNSLLEKLQLLEKQFGRQPKLVLNEPRPLDLDLIAFGTRTSTSPRLTLPHPRAHLRAFVLAPLNEVAPNLILPGQQKSVTQLLADLPNLPTLIRKLGAR